MKKNLPVLFVFFLLAVLSCSKNEQLCCAIPTTFYMHAQMGADSIWDATPQLSLDTSATTKTWSATSEDERTVWITLKKNENNTWLLDTAGYFTTLGGDIVTSQYSLSPEETNSLAIQNEDTETLAGSFDLTFKRIDSRETTGSASIRFTDGAFIIPAKK